MLDKNPLMVRRGQWLKPSRQHGAGEQSHLGLAGLRALAELLPALPPPASAARVLRDRPLASRPCSSRVAFHRLVSHPGQKNVEPD